MHNEIDLMWYKLKLAAWLIGTSGFVFGISDRVTANLSDGTITSIDLVQIFTALFFLLCYVVLNPVKLK